MSFYSLDKYKYKQAVLPKRCDCGQRDREQKFICPQCDGTNTNLNDWENKLKCHDCNKTTDQEKNHYVYRFHCNFCNTRGIGHHFIPTAKKQTEQRYGF